MKTTIKQLKLVDLTTTEQIEIDGGSERKDEKQTNILELLWAKLTGATD
ncbi:MULTISPECIES: hypothetical protein [Sphingobacterium]|nr:MULTISPECIES: hypothetical protein [unclassified Sphingobacterium]